MKINMKNWECVVECLEKNNKEMTLNEISNKLPKQIFVQSHRCYIVNLMYIRHINGNLIYMSNGTELTVSRTYRNELMKRFREFYLKG